VNIACDLAGEFVLKVLDSHNCGLLLVNKAEVRLRIYSRVKIFKQSMGTRNRVVMRLLYLPARLHRLAEFIPWNRFLGSINVYKYGLSCLAVSKL
jgi:hypothetical protein